MKKKIISWALVGFLMCSLGCYSNQTMTKEGLDANTREGLKAECEQADITVFTKDSSEYKFLKGNYRIQSDTLTGFGFQTIDGTDGRFHGSLSFADITSLRTEKFNLGRTIFASAMAAGFGGVILYTLAARLSEH